jgi:hypothetical protein
VTSSPAFSTISVNGRPQGATPVEISLGRRRGEQVIRIESPGYNPFQIQVGGDRTAPNFSKSLLLGAAAGGLVAVAQTTSTAHHYSLWKELAIDAPVGAALFVLIDLIPKKENIVRSRELLVTLTKASGTPRVEMMRIEAADFRAIKWIRVHRD